MKKYFALTSVLVLAACGGSGGGFVDNLTPEQRAAVDSNTNVTGMLTYLETDDNGNTLDSRSATGRTSGLLKHAGKYDLSDVDFNLADEGFGGIVKFNVDKNKKITGFSIVDDEGELINVDGRLAYKQNDNDDLYMDGGVLKKHNPGATLSGPDENGIYTYEYDDMNGSFIVKDNEIIQLYEGDASSTRVVDGKMYAAMNFNRTGDKNYTFAGRVNGQHGETDALLTYNSFGKDLKLKYSDFGYFQLESDGDKDRPVSVIGGYGVKRIDQQNMPNRAMTFYGHASGSVIAFRNDTDPELLELYTKNANVKFENGASTMTAKFNNWYDVKYNEEYTAGGDVATRNINLSNYKVATNSGVAPDYFRMLSDTNSGAGYASAGANGLTMNSVVNAGFGGDNFDSIQSDVRYYGDHGTPSEVVGLVQVTDCAGNDCGDHQDQIRMNMSFGGKK